MSANGTVTVRHHVEGLLCPECRFPLRVSHRYESVHRVACDNEACKLFGKLFEQPYEDFELKPVAMRKR